MTVFFTLSGYLITRILVRELDATGRIDFKRFFKRRAVRLLPALGVVVGVYLLLGGLVSRALAALTYTSNYARTLDFDLGEIHHAWSLAVEEHFYLVWPFALLFIPSRHRVKALVALVAAFGFWRVGVILVGATDWVYYGTDTNAVAILAGCLAAVAGRERIGGKWWIGVLLLAPMVVTHRTDLFSWAVFLVVVATVGVILNPPKWLAWQPLVWIGTISYGVYLWHYLLLDFNIPPLVALPVTFLLSALSWVYVERPLLNARTRGRPLTPTPSVSSGTLR